MFNHTNDIITKVADIAKNGSLIEVTKLIYYNNKKHISEEKKQQSQKCRNNKKNSTYSKFSEILVLRVILMRYHFCVGSM